MKFNWETNCRDYAYNKIKVKCMLPEFQDVKYKNVYLHFGKATQEYLCSGEIKTIGIAFFKKLIVFYINPPKNINHFKLASSDKKKLLYSDDIIKKIFSYIKVDYRVHPNFNLIVQELKSINNSNILLTAPYLEGKCIIKQKEIDEAKHDFNLLINSATKNM